MKGIIMQKQTAFLLAALGLALFIGGPLAAKPTNKILKIGMTQEFENLNPIIMQMRATSYIYKMVCRHLLTIDADGKWQVQLATTIPTLKNGLAAFKGAEKDKKLHVKWEIKEKAKWGDGKPVTAHDLYFSWRVALTDTVSVGDREDYENIERIDIDPKNPKRFTMVYKRAKWDFNQMFGFQILPKHLEEKVFTAHAKENEGYAKNSLYTRDPTNPGLYNGPYLVIDIKLGSHMIIVPNPHFYGKKPNVQKIILKLIPNTNTLEANLRSGNIDMISIMGLSFDQALAFEKKVAQEKLPFDVNFRQGLVYEHIDLQLKNDILKDIIVRKALVYAINRDDLTAALFESKQKKAIHFVSPIDPWYTEDEKWVVSYKYSRRTAKKLLEKAGWKIGKNGIRQKNGKPLKLSLMTTAGDKTRELVEVYLKEQWQKIGVDIEIKNEPARVYFGETIKKAKYTGMAMYAWISQPESSPKAMLTSKNIPSQANAYSGSNSGNWRNKEVDQLLSALEYEFDEEKRKAIIHQVIYHYTNEVPVIPLNYRSDVSVTPKNLTSYRLTGHLHDSSNHVEYWSLN